MWPYILKYYNASDSGCLHNPSWGIAHGHLHYQWSTSVNSPLDKIQYCQNFSIDFDEQQAFLILVSQEDKLITRHTEYLAEKHARLFQDLKEILDNPSIMGKLS